MSAPEPFADARTVLAIQPHYDDNDIGAGGTLAALARSGVRVVYVTATDDRVGVLDESLSDAEIETLLCEEQAQAAREIGVAENVRLGFPDAGPYDYYALRGRIIAQIRRLSPDYLLTVDPWLPLEAHSDHRQVGLAVAEASMLYALTRLASDPEIDAAYVRHALRGVAFYFTRDPTHVVCIDATREVKHRAIAAYRAQFTTEQLRVLHQGLEAKEREWAQAEPFEFGEPLRFHPPGALHVNL